MFHSKHFSLQEAEDLLPEVNEILRSIILCKGKLYEMNYDVKKHSFFGGVSTNGTGKYPDELLDLIELIKKLQNMGIQLKDPDRGLIDFPHIRFNGEEVYLCYMYGESSVKFWHYIKDGFRGRRDISEL
ncbi:MAG: DUF2203 domain-containing protein [Bacteroidetes bacterium]|nr:DUF2203 domain-containing protein [Bacteroidota bacterium]